MFSRFQMDSNPCLRTCLLLIVFACSRLRHSPVGAGWCSFAVPRWSREAGTSWETRHHLRECNHLRLAVFREKC